MRKIWAIAKNTFREALRQRSLQVIVVFALVLIGASQLFSFLTAEEEMKMIKDVSLATIEFFGALLAIFGTISTMNTEIEKRTLYTLLSKPIKRHQFLFGKFVGVSLTILLNFSIMVLFFVGLILFKEKTFSIELSKALSLIFFELLLISSITLLISTFGSMAFNLIFSFFIYFTGHLITYGRQLVSRTENVLLSSLGKVLYNIIPNFENFNIRDKVVVGVFVPFTYLLKNVGYGLIYITICLLLSVYLFARREI